MAETVMIHQVHGSGYPEKMGSVAIEKLERVVEKHPDYVYTFDDGLACQQLAFPVLQNYSAKAIFFVNNQNENERHRMIRERLGFDFWIIFWRWYGRKPKPPKEFLSEYDFYTPDDKAYRWVRDFSDPEGHDKTMDWISDQTEVPEFIDPQIVVDNGYELGLHSATHPRRMDIMKPHLQYDEWMDNLGFIQAFQPHLQYASYPMGRYNHVTIEILRQLNIETAYTSSANTSGQYEQPRTDIKNII